MFTKDYIGNINTVKDLKEAGYQPMPVKEEIRKNLVKKLSNNENPFEGIWGYEETVIPEVERAILSLHNINFLGLRGQAKTRMARMMIDLMDEYIPYIEGCEIPDDPLSPISYQGRELLEQHGDETRVAWLHRNDRYTEKLATPDVTVADLIGDIDPIKAASLKLPYSDPRVIHFGLIPRAHRGLFVINEIPDLQARIQVALFNILQEGDIQIRGFKTRLPLDIQFVFTANPEDYTNRGSIVTPLKDRIDSQIMTHYPKTIEVGKKITAQEARLQEDQQKMVKTNELIKDLLEQISFEARESEYVDEKSGVSARLTISGYENLVSTAERRALINNEKETYVRISDLWGVIPSITGKVELVYEGETEGPYIVSQNLIGKAVRAKFMEYFPDPEKMKKEEQEKNPYQEILDWFSDGNLLDIKNDYSNKEYEKTLNKVPGLKNLIEKYHSKETKQQKLFLMEFALHGLAEYSMISKNPITAGLEFKDLFSSMFQGGDINDEDLGLN